MMKDTVVMLRQRLRTIEFNLKNSRVRLAERNKLGKERGIKEPQVIPEGYWDEDKHLKEAISIAEKQRKEVVEQINSIIRANPQLSFSE